MSIRVTLTPGQLSNPAIFKATSILIAELRAAGQRFEDLPEDLLQASGKPCAARFQPLFTAENTPKFERFAAHLPRRSQEFLRQLCKCRYFSTAEAIEKLQLNPEDGARTVNGLSSAIARKAALHDLPAPFVLCDIDGQKGWYWVGPSMPQNETAQEKPQPVQKEALFAQDASMTDAAEAQASLHSARNSDRAPKAPKAPFPEALCNLLDAQGQLFLRTLYERGWMPLYDLLTLFQMPRAKSLGCILEPIQRQLQKLGIKKPFSKEIVGHWRIYVWSGVAVPNEVPEPTERTPKTKIRKRRNPRPNRRPATGEGTERAALREKSSSSRPEGASKPNALPKARNGNGSSGRNYGHYNKNPSRNSHFAEDKERRPIRRNGDTSEHAGEERNRSSRRPGDAAHPQGSRSRNRPVKMPEVTVIQRKSSSEQIPVVRIRRPNEP